MTRRTRAPEAAALLAALALVAGCARKLPPSGGPPDLEPPWIASVSPDSGAVNVPRTTRPAVTFSEDMDPKAGADAVQIAPRVDVRQKRWKGRTLVVVLADSLKANRTYTLFVGTEARDRHGNAMRDGRAVVFTTAATFPPGRIEGTIEPVGFDVAGTYVWCYPEGHAPDSTARDFDAVGLAAADGTFRIGGLAVPGRYRLWVFADLNHNRSFEPASDLLAPADTTIALTAAQPLAAGLRLKVVNPRAPGRVRGAVLDSVSGGVGALRLIVVSQQDTLRRLLYEIDEHGGFDFKFDPGGYRLRAFRDLDRNKIWKRETEPASAETTITVTPGGAVDSLRFVLVRPPAAGAPPAGGGP